MQRRDFIRNISLLGLGLGAFPNQLFAASNQWTVLNLQTQLQTRHGFFNLVNNQTVGKDWWETLQKNIFYKNGYEPSEEDLTLYSFDYQEKKYLITSKNNVLTIGVAGKTHLYSLEATGLLYQDEDTDLSISIAKGDIFTNKKEEIIVLPISNDTKIDNYMLQEGEILRMSSKNQTVTTNKKILIIKTKKKWTNQQLQVKPLSA